MVCLSCVCYFVSSSLFLCCLLNFHPGHEKKRTQNGVCIKACKMGGRGRRNRTGTLRLGLLLSTVGNCLNVCNVQRRALHFASLVIWFDGLIGLDGCTHLVDTFLYLFLMWLVLFVCLFVCATSVTCCRSERESVYFGLEIRGKTDFVFVCLLFLSRCHHIFIHTMSWFHYYSSLLLFW